MALSGVLCNMERPLVRHLFWCEFRDSDVVAMRDVCDDRGADSDDDNQGEAYRVDEEHHRVEAGIARCDTHDDITKRPHAGDIDDEADENDRDIHFQSFCGEFSTTSASLAVVLTCVAHIHSILFIQRRAAGLDWLDVARRTLPLSWINYTITTYKSNRVRCITEEVLAPKMLA